jgi:hypothetical protein
MRDMISLMILVLSLGMALGLAIDQAQSHNSLGDLFDGQLANLSRAAPWGNPYLGGQSLNHCCALAVNDSLELHNGTVFFRPGQTTMTGTVEDFLSAPFPCDAEYDGSTAFPPQVWITYIWCQHNCDGWAAPWIDIYSLRFWLKPLVLFIIPSTVFSLNIPRRRRMGVPRWLFPRRLSSISDLLTLSYKVPIAALIVTVDMLIWTLIILTMSGPMLLSGIYEAVLDQRILDFVTNRIKRNSLTIRQRAHLLLIILFGSLDLDHAWGELRTTISDLPNDNLRRRSSQATVVSSPQTHVSLRSRSDVGSMNSISTGRKSRRPAEYTSTTKSHINAMKAKLRSVMQSQLTFGTAAGAAIIFYSGNFAYILLEIREDFGDPYVFMQSEW